MSAIYADKRKIRLLGIIYLFGKCLITYTILNKMVIQIDTTSSFAISCESEIFYILQNYSYTSVSEIIAL